MSPQSISDAALPVPLGSAGAAYSGSISASRAANDLSDISMNVLNSTPLAISTKSSTATAMPITWEMRSGT